MKSFLDYFNDYHFKLSKEAPLHGNAYQLYMYLLKWCDLRGYANPFRISKTFMMSEMDMGHDAFDEARQTLIDLGYLQCSSKKGKAPGVYYLPHVEKKGEVELDDKCVIGKSGKSAFKKKEKAENPLIKDKNKSGKSANNSRLKSGKSANKSNSTLLNEKNKLSKEQEIHKEDQADTSALSPQATSQGDGQSVVVVEKETPLPVPVEKIDYDWLMEAWNTICTAMPKIKCMTDDRKEKVRQRVRKMNGWAAAKPHLEFLFRKMMKSPFLRGEISNWKANFDWFFANDKNWVKVEEGNYREDSDPQSNSLTQYGSSAVLPPPAAGGRTVDTVNWQQKTINARVLKTKERRKQKLAALDEQGGFTTFEEV